MSHVFLSYSHKDVKFMHRVRDGLRTAGLDVWTDEDLEPGTPAWTAAVESAIENANCIVVLLSPDAKDSEWVERELAEGQANGLRIFPVLVRGNELDAIPFRLRATQWSDARRGRFDLAMAKLIGALYKFLSLGSVPPIPPKSSLRRILIALAGAVLVAGVVGVILATGGLPVGPPPTEVPTTDVTGVPIDVNTQFHLARILEDHLGWVTSLAWSPDGTQLASASADNRVFVWDAVTGGKLLVFRGHSGVVTGVTWSPDGARLASASSDNRIIVWDSATGESSLSPMGYSEALTSIAWSLDGTRLAAGAVDGVVTIWDAVTAEKLLTLGGHDQAVSSVDWSFDSARLASAGSSWDQTIIVWSAETGNSLWTLEGHSSPVNDVAWSPDGSRLASSSSDGQIVIWAAGTGQRLQSLEGHTNSVSSIAWSPDGEWMVSGSADHTLTVWNPKTGEQLHTLEEHTAALTSVAWSPDGTRLASGDKDGKVIIWESSQSE